MNISTNTQFKRVEVIFSTLLLLLFAISSAPAQNATWVGTTGDINTASNWNPSGVPSSGFTYTFDNTGITTTVTGNPASGVLIVVNSAAGIKDYTLSGVLSGATTVTKNGTSTLVLSGANTHTGVTNVNAGTLNIQNNTALGTSAGGTVVASGARLQLQNNITVAGEPLTLNGANPISATGGVITTSGDNVIHTFTSSGTFTITSGGMVDYLVVGGGGGASGGSSGGGGGGGGVLVGNMQLAASSYPVTVGAGGSGGTVTSNPIWTGAMGNNSTFAGLVAYGGGRGGDGFAGENMNGASGGGGRTGGEVARPTYTSAGSAIYGAQGNNGGRGFKTRLVGGGGGGAGSAGLDGSMTKAGDGGAGLASSISGTALFYGGGGGGGGQAGSAPATRGIGGSGVGGDGSILSDGAAGANGFGGGGGGSGYDGSGKNGGSGGSGVVIIRYSATNNSLESVSGNNAWSGNIMLSGPSTIGVGAGTLTVSGVISGAFDLNKSGTGTLQLTNANTYTGVTNVTAGTLNIQNNGALGTTDNGTVVATTAKLQLQNNITVAGEALTLNGSSSPISATGGTITISGDTTTHSFTSSGTFTVNTSGSMNFLVVGGGGGSGASGATWTAGSGGGGGGVQFGTQTVSAGVYPITVGAGGSGQTTEGVAAGSGGSSTALGVTATGGTGGIRGAPGGMPGSGNSSATGGTCSVNGGNGVTWPGNNTTYGGGGGGGGGCPSIGIGGAGGGGNGGNSFSIQGQPGAPNTGGGGGGTGRQYGDTPVFGVPGVSGGSGIVILRYLNTTLLENVSGDNSWTGTVTMLGDNRIATTSGTLTISGVISGAYALTKNGTGTLTLTNANTYSGGTIFNAGTLNINHTNALGSASGTFTINGGIINNTSGSTITTVNYPQAWNADFTFTGTNDLNLGAGAVTMSGTRQITTSTSGRSLTIGGAISGAGFGLTKDGAGTMVLSGANTYTGVTNVNTGILNIQSNGALGTSANGTVVAHGARLQLQNNIIVSDEPLTLTGLPLLSATGGTITTSGGYTIHTFTTSGTFSANGSGTVEYLVVGGGGGGSSGAGGGGGAGGFLTGSLSVPSGSYPILVGSGGVGAGSFPAGNYSPATSGGNSTFSTINALGGGKAGGQNDNAGNGGSGGGGGGGTNQPSQQAAGAGTAGQGNAGANGIWMNRGAGGGGAGGAASGVTGGAAMVSAIRGIATAYAGGGGGGTWSVAAGNGGGGGAGNGTQGILLRGVDAVANTGSGGGGGGGENAPLFRTAGGGNGGSGIVIVRYLTPPPLEISLENVSGDNSWTGTVTMLGNNIMATTAGMLTITGVISGAYTLTKNGTGTLTLTNANTYSGGTIFNTGTLNINNTNALGTGSGTLTINGGTIDNTSGAPITTASHPQVWNADFTFTGTNDLNVGGGAVTMSASRQVTTTTAGRTLTVRGILNNNTQNLIKEGAGILAFGSQIIRLQSLIINAGTLSSTSGTFSLAGDFTNNSTFNHRNGRVLLNGTTATQTIGGSSPTSFNNLSLSNTSGINPQILLGAPAATVEGTLNMSNSNAVNLNSRTLTLGKDAATIGTLVYTSGLLYGGTFKRWMSTPTMAINDARGHFPMGTSLLDRRPVWLGYSALLTGAGTVSVSHLPVYPSFYVNQVHTDATWDTGTSIQGISNSRWNISTADGFEFNSNTGLLRFGGQGFGIFSLGDLNATLATSCVGTFSAATNTTLPLEVNRTGLTTAMLADTWYIGTKNTWSSPLPVELLNFDATYLEETGFVQLEWSTATQIDNDYFTVESSPDGIHWTPILRKQGAGTTYQLMSYVDVDKHPYDGINYYRLQQTDYNGDYSYSKTIALNIQRSIDNKVIAFPSPVNDILNISSPGISFEEIFILDSKGAIVAQTTNPDLSENIQIDVGSFRNGNYVLKLKSKNKIATRKITIVH